MSTTNHSTPERRTAPRSSFGKAGSLDGIFNPRTVAIIGASEQPGTEGQKTLLALMGTELAGRTFVVQGEHSTALGKTTYASLSAVPEKIDLAVAVTVPEAAPDVLAECVEKGVKGVILISSDFGAPGGDRAEAVHRMRTILGGSRTRVIGPNSLGVMNPLIGLNATPGLQMPIGGTVALLSESPLLGRFVLDWSFKHIVGFSAFASLGTMLDVSWANLIDYFGRDPGTRAIVIQISSIGETRSLISAAREVSLNKPIIVTKAGRTDASIHAVGWASRCAVSDDEVLQAAFRRVGVLQVDTLEELFYAADALSKQPRPQGPRLMVVSNADGPGVLAADSIVRSGVEIAQPSGETREQLKQLLGRENRLEDVIGDGSPESYAKAVEVAAKDPNCDGLLLLMVPWALSDPQRTSELLVGLRDSCAKPILISYLGGAETPAAQETLARACFPTFSSPATAARIFHYMWRYSYDLQGLYETPILHHDHNENAHQRAVQKLIDAVRQKGQTSLTQSEAMQILAAYEILTAEPGSSFPRATVAFRAKVGSRIDPQFGPVLIFGPAGGGAEVYGDAAIGLPPLNATLARRMMEQGKFYGAMRRECRSTSIPELEALLVRFSHLIAEQPWIKELEINPLLIAGEHVVAVGARCEVHGPEVREDELAKPAIRPYPVQYVSPWTMKNGQSVTIRPIRAEDEPLMVKFHEGLSDRSVYLRYFQRVKLRTRTAHERLSRVCFLDYDREFALLAEHLDPQTKERKIIAVATLAKIPPRSEGEVAVLISDDHHGQGLGKELIGRLVGVARDEGLHRVTASTMMENLGMCAIFERLGFQLSTNFEEQLVDAKLVLE